MNDVVSRAITGLTVAGLLAIVGAATYATVGGPLVIAGGMAIALVLVVYRLRHGPEPPTSMRFK